MLPSRQEAREVAPGQGDRRPYVCHPFRQRRTYRAVGRGRTEFLVAHPVAVTRRLRGRVGAIGFGGRERFAGLPAAGGRGADRAWARRRSAAVGRSGHRTERTFDVVSHRLGDRRRFRRWMDRGDGWELRRRNDGRGNLGDHFLGRPRRGFSDFSDGWDDGLRGFDDLRSHGFGHFGDRWRRGFGHFLDGWKDAVCDFFHRFRHFPDRTGQSFERAGIGDRHPERNRTDDERATEK